MNVAQLEARWRSIIYSGTSPFRSLLISADCLPELFIAVDARSFRFIILQVPAHVNVDCPSLIMQNLSLEWHKDTRFIVIGLLNNQYCDLYNDFALSLYHRIKDISSPELYAKEFISNFHKWAAFFDDAHPGELTESEVKGLFGELTVLNWYLNNCSDISSNQLIQGWQGPYGRAKDFIFPGYDLEVKTKDEPELSINISSEHQLESQPGKEIQLAIVDVKSDTNGENLQKLVLKIKETLFSQQADIPYFIKTLTKAGIGSSYINQYDKYRWVSLRINWYNCNTENFPRLIPGNICDAISDVKYQISTNSITSFLIKTIDPKWT